MRTMGLQKSVDTLKRIMKKVANAKIEEVRLKNKAWHESFSDDLFLWKKDLWRPSQPIWEDLPHLGDSGKKNRKPV